jgi:arylsulfatase
VPPKGAPNVLLILLDDAGYGANSTFGGVIPTPTLDKIAANGLRYTNFHSTSLCSPTRGALLTGRNHHSVGFGVISEVATGFPGYNSVMGPENATIAKILGENGYRSAWWGKNHNTPAFETSQAGPFTQWPTGGMGFDYFYGFMGGDSSQWEPMLTRNTTPITPFVGKPGWNLITAMADDAIEWMTQLNDLDPALPFFIYYAPGCDACAASSDAGVDQEDQRHAPVRRGIQRDPREDLRQPEEARRNPARREADPLAGRPHQAVGPALRRGKEALHPAGRRLWGLHGLRRR